MLRPLPGWALCPCRGGGCSENNSTCSCREVGKGRWGGRRRATTAEERSLRGREVRGVDCFYRGEGVVFASGTYFGVKAR